MKPKTLLATFAATAVFTLAADAEAQAPAEPPVSSRRGADNIRPWLGPTRASELLMRLLLKNVLFTLVVPGTVGVLLPYLIVSDRAPAIPRSWGVAQLAAVAVALLGLAVYLACIWQFAHRGRATPAPIDAPKVLVARGPYRYVRNPMYLGVLLWILAEALFFEAGVLVLYAGVFLLVVHLFIVFYEEPTLRRKFGSSYDAYREAVPRWVPRKPGRPA